MRESEKIEHTLWIAFILVLLTLVAYKYQLVKQAESVQTETTLSIPDSEAVANDELLGGREEPNQP